MIEFKNVYKKYKEKVVFENISLKLEKGVYIICGENGSGKSTFLKLIKGFASPTQGKIDIEGKISYTPEKIHFPSFLTITEVIESVKRIYKSTTSVLSLLHKYQITKYKNYKLNNISKGTYQKILLIISELRDFDIYLYDEPLNGLDDETVKTFILSLQELALKNKLIIISSHLVDNYKSLPIQILSIKNKNIYQG